jgi:hypothetical protein
MSLSARLHERQRCRRHRKGCNVASVPVFVRLERRFDGMAEDRGSPGFPEVYWARHIIGQAPAVHGPGSSLSRAALADAIAKLSGWLLLTAHRQGAELCPLDVAAALDALQVATTIGDRDPLECLPPGEDEYTGCDSWRLTGVRQLCERAVDELSVSVAARSDLLFAMLIGDGRVGLA